MSPEVQNRSQVVESTQNEPIIGPKWIPSGRMDPNRA